MKGTLINHSSDNKATHTILGMSEGFNANYYCQHCKMLKRVCRRSTEEDPTLMRTVDDYRIAFADRTRIYAQIGDAFGMLRYTYLDRINGYNIFRNLTVDLMHDFAEGSIPDIIRKFLKRVIQFGVMTIQAVNEAIVVFDYGFINRNNLPGGIDLSPSLGLTASQKIVLFLHFPLIFRNLANHPRLRQYWPAVTSLESALKICLSKTISEADLGRLDRLIRFHLNELVVVYQANLKPKQHFMTHYTRVIREMGPPTTMWTMR